jgi:glycogen debranching enzyme
MSIKKQIIFMLALVIILTTGLSCTAQQTTGSANKTWLSPAKIQVSDVLPGKHIEQSITIHNGSDVTTTFLVYYRMPDYVADNFVVAPADAQDWVKIGEESPVLAPRETKEIQVILDLPNNAQIPENWEFWIGVKTNNGNSLITELCTRWLITMK